MTFRKRSGRKLVVTPDGAQWAPRPRVDNAMVKALARAFRWRKMLDEGGEEQGVQLTTYVSPAQSAASTLLVTKVGWTRSRNPRRSRPFGWTEPRADNRVVST